MKPYVYFVLAVLLVSILAVYFVVVLNLNLWPTAVDIQHSYQVKVAFPNLLFDHPVGIYNAGDGSNRLFVIEQPGFIRVFENSANTSVASVFLNISSRVVYGGEMGLLGLAFHPNFSVNGYFYVDYIVDNPRRTMISRFSASSDNPNVANVSSEFILLVVEQPFANHNGGQIAFGLDGYFYVALGDGGGAGDPLGNGQNRSTLLGSILRIDVNSASASLNYSIPFDNPFVGNTAGYREEIYAYGLRNPWRFSFDTATGWLWTADVGQNTIEEVDLIENGKNYGWNIMEGSLCYSPSTGCNQTGLTLPIWEYNHTLGYSVTGGFVYHGLLLPELAGSYIYGDYGSGRIWALQYNGTGAPINTEIVDSALNIPSFGLDENNELYICAFDGKIYRLSILDNIPPMIGNPIHDPQEPMLDQEVKVTVNVTDDISGVKEVILSYTNDSVWTNITMTSTGNDGYAANITAMPYQTTVSYKITATDNANNIAVNDNLGLLYTYTVIPEFPNLIASTLMMLVAPTIVLVLRKKERKPQ